ncbi:MAG: hypothetical protein ACFFBD_07015 [Candidatus Hodarchaeota archaeon]
MNLRELLDDAFVLAAPYLSSLAFIRAQLETLSTFENTQALLAYINQAEKDEETLQKQTDWRIFKSKIQSILEQDK